METNISGEKYGLNLSGRNPASMASQKGQIYAIDTSRLHLHLCI